MPQLVEYMKVSVYNKVCCNQKNNRFKMQHAAYSNRWHLLKKRAEIMKKRYFDMIVIIIIGIFLIALAVFDLLEKSAKFMLIPILTFYYIG